MGRRIGKFVVVGLEIDHETGRHSRHNADADARLAGRTKDGIAGVTKDQDHAALIAVGAVASGTMRRTGFTHSMIFVPGTIPNDRFLQFAHAAFGRVFEVVPRGRSFEIVFNC